MAPSPGCFSGALAVEYLVTLADSIVEDRTRRLLRAERLVHMILGATTGPYVALIIYHASIAWIDAPTALRGTQHGVVSIILSIYAASAIVSGLRDLLASRRLAAEV